MAIVVFAQTNLRENRIFAVA